MQQHRFSYNEAMPVESCTQALSDLALRFGEDDDEEGGMVGSHILMPHVLTSAGFLLDATHPQHSLCTAKSLIR